ncbi:MAG: hypothetical protein IT327_10130 [Anaerolineae bacterium]|nr:hypothetical protein [Anaerolineae bacterium]
MPKFVRKPLVFLLMLLFSLSACQRYQTYTDSSLGFTINHPTYWEPYQGEPDEGVWFNAKEQGDVTIWIRVFDEVSAATAVDSVQLQVDEYLKDIELLSGVQMSTYEHAKYDIASAFYIIQAANVPFEMEIYTIVIQNSDRMAVIFTIGDGYEPEKAAEAIIDSFDFLPQ